MLREAGPSRGDSVALLSDNDIRCFVVYWAALRSGLYVTAVEPPPLRRRGRLHRRRLRCPRRRFDAEGGLAAIEQYRAMHSQWAPTMFVRMLELPEDVRARCDVSSLRVAVHAAAPCPVEVRQAMIDWWGPVLHEYYSSTEGNGITFIDSEQWPARPGSVGRGGVLGDIRICDDDGAVAPPGEVGTVYFERDQLPFVYHNAPEMGESVKAVVRVAAGTNPGPDLADALIAYVRGRIAGYKTPRSVDFVDELPRTQTGKLVKRDLRDRYRPSD